ncbi:MAG TPA: DUF3488 and transglutaminase-like domain-containing protein [Rhodocyclaceae bacterium]|nr:DUF3488 and transglutaminase-like domain-containing protein [Rhodocyclaceae bacterium]
MARSKTSSPAITQRQVLWLAASALAVVLPLAPYLPVWLMALCLLGIVWRGWLIWRRVPLPPLWLVNLCALTGAAGVAFHFHTFFGKDSGVALLTLLVALKLFETRSVRDAMAVVLLELFLTSTQFFYTQAMSSAVVMAGAVLLITATLIVLQRDEAPPRVALGSAARMLGMALPFMLLLFILVPRISGPLWGLPADGAAGTTGLSDSMSPGSISELSQSEAIAFRVRFIGPMPPRSDLYWRGPVLNDFDGTTWRPGQIGTQPQLPYAVSGTSYDYEMTLEPHNRPWLLALDFPGSFAPESAMGLGYQLLATKPVRSRLRYRLQAFPDAEVGVQERTGVIRAALRLPAAGNPEARALATQLRRDNASPMALVNAFLQRIKRESYIYTLTPPLLGKDSVDEFLFATQRGFCEHYASAFVFVMRAAGIPARVVTGYQGGEINPVDGYLEVRQSDAHAWAEVWLKDKGWQRVDPTAAVAPSRVENNLAAAVPRGDPRPLLAQPHMEWLRQWRYRWEAVNNTWNQWVLGYDNQRQLTMLRKIGFNAPDWHTMAALLTTVGGALLIAAGLWTLRSRERTDPVSHQWQIFERKLAHRGLVRKTWEGPADYRVRLTQALPTQADEIASICRLYETLRYGRVSAPLEAASHLEELKRTIAAFTPHHE